MTMNRTKERRGRSGRIWSAKERDPALKSYPRYFYHQKIPHKIGMHIHSDKLRSKICEFGCALVGFGVPMIDRDRLGRLKKTELQLAGNHSGFG